MPWYYIEVHSGGGHQSTTSKWAWRDKPVPIKTSTDIANFVDGEFDGEYFGGDSAIFHVKRVRKLPIQTKTQLLAMYANRITHAQEMLKVLARTSAFPPRCTYRTSRMPTDSFPAQCNRDAGHKGRCDARGRHNRERHGAY